MARIYPLFSSSKGNATYVGTSSAGILIDAGITYSRLLEGLRRSELDISAIQAIFITHIHSDHIKGLSVLTKKTGIPVFAQEITINHLIASECLHSRGEVLRRPVEAAGMEIKAFCTPHDTVQSCGFRITTSDGKQCAVCTDLGHITLEVEENLSGCDLVLLESNYDEKMLKFGGYPEYLKARIRSKRGHLSNRDCAAQVEKLISDGTTRVILGHLSQENNTPQTADSTIEAALSGFVRNKDYILDVAPVETTGKCMIF